MRHVPAAADEDLDRARVDSTRRSRGPATSADGAILTVLSGDARGTVARIPGGVGETLRVGKAADNDLVLPDETISRHHFDVERATDGIKVRDLESTNGLRIGGAFVKEALVAPGTIVRAGDVELLVGVEIESAVIPPSPNNHFGLAVGSSLEMRRIFGILERIAPTMATVLLTGETGTGKDALARSIHLESARADGPFEVVDCGVVTGTLIESELFGHERGAFTGAVAARAGAFERAQGGTIFLDEIGELPLDLQPKLLRVLDAREFRRVGGAKTLAADVRVIAATTRDLSRAMQGGEFRDDLFFRLAVIAIHVPPLRKRVDDVALLVDRLLAGSGVDVAAETLAAFKSYDWPGNVRELRNVLERSVHFARAAGSTRLELSGFPPVPRHGADDDDDDVTSFEPSLTFRETRARIEARFERRYVRWLLARHNGNVSAAAREARMDRTHLTDLARKHGVDRRRP